jgi:hypothetical protein
MPHLLAPAQVAGRGRLQRAMQQRSVSTSASAAFAAGYGGGGGFDYFVARPPGNYGIM